MKISEIHYQELYFFLMSCLDQGLITLADADKIYERIYAEIGLVDADVIPKLLKLLVLEREEEKLERRVNAMCDSNLQLIASLQQQADDEEGDDDDDGGADDYDLEGGVDDDEEEEEGDEDGLEDDEDEDDDESNSGDDDGNVVGDSNSSSTGPSDVRAPVLRVQSGKLKGGRTLAPLAAVQSESQVDQESVCVARDDETKSSERQRSSETKTGGVPVSPHDVVVDNNDPVIPDESTGTASKDEKRRSKYQSKLRKLKKERDRQLTELAMSKKSPDEVAALTKSIIDKYKRRRKKIKAAMLALENEQDVEGLGTSINAAQRKYNSVAASRTDEEIAAADQLAKQIEEKFRVQLDQSLRDQALALASSRKTLTARIQARQASRKHRQADSIAQKDQHGSATDSQTDKPTIAAADDELSTLLEKLEIETVLLDAESRNKTELLHKNRDALSIRASSQASLPGGSSAATEDLAFLKVETKLAQRVAKAKDALQSQVLERLAAVGDSEPDPKFAKDLIKVRAPSFWRSACCALSGLDFSNKQ